MSRTRIAAVGVTTAFLAALLPMATSPSIAAPAPIAPKGLTVARDATALNDLQITWKTVAGAAHYMVRVNDGTKDTNYVVDAASTSFTHRGAGACTRYRVWVSAVAADGSAASTNSTYVASLAPGGVSSVRGLRTELGSVATVLWSAPSQPGYSPVTDYSVVFAHLSTGKKLVTRNSIDTQEKVGGLAPTSMYTAKVTARNEFGSCVTSTFVVGSNRPASPQFTVDRATAEPSSAVVSWNTPAWQGYGPVTAYVIGYKNITAKGYTWMTVDSSTRKVTVPKLDPTIDWTFVMRAHSSNDVGLLSRTVVLRKSGYNPINAAVKVSGGADTINVDFSAPVGSSTNYPKAVVSVARANGTNGWTDKHTVTNGAGIVSFLPVPCGTYAVTVTGVGGAMVQELVRTTARVCDLPPECFVSTLTNGGFEAPVLPAKTYRIMPSSTAGLSWNNTAESVVEMWSSGFGGVPAAQGNQFAELNANKAGTLYQDLPTIPGTTMRWHLNHRGRTGTDTMRVLVGAPAGKLVQSGANLVTPKTAWVQYTGTYTIPAGQTVTRFAFQAVNSGSYGNLLDDVVFTPESCQ